MTADQIEAAGQALVRFSTLEICLILFSIILAIAIIWLGRHWLKIRMAKINNDNQLKITELNNNRQQIDEENNALIKHISDRVDNIEVAETNWQKYLDKKFVEYDKRFDKIEAGNEKRFDRLESSMESLFHAISDQEEKFYKVSQGTLETMLFNDAHKSKFDRLKAFYRLTAMGVNGRVWVKGTSLIMESEEAKELWLDVLSLKLDVEIVNKEYFDQVMDRISRECYSGRMGAAA